MLSPFVRSSITMYQNLYNLINTYIFAGAITPDSYEELVCILISTVGSLFLVALPFILVYFCIDIVYRSIARGLQ